jgi:deoxycytidylate deaminase
MANEHTQQPSSVEHITSEVITARPELLIGLVGAAGTNLDFVISALRDCMSTVDYDSHIIRLSNLLREIDLYRDLPDSPEDVRYHEFMDAGNGFRERINHGAALALLAASAIKHWRGKLAEEQRPDARGDAFILRSLKHKEEVEVLRKIYGGNFVLISAYAPRPLRIERIARQIARSRKQSDPLRYTGDAEGIVERDTNEPDKALGQNVRECFPMADIFVDASDERGCPLALRRFVEILFCHPYRTPTRDEYGMFHARAAALRSSEMGRQVGAVVTTSRGEIISVGTNEVPRPGGGLYWAGDTPDQRNFRLGYDTSDQMKEQVLADVLGRFQSAGWLNPDRTSTDVDQLVRELLIEQPAVLRGSRLLSLIEFGRAVHAEMDALLDAARRGVPVQDCSMYTTTFPCHDCARHVVAAGIRRVIYIEAYPKSLASYLYPDSVAVDAGSAGKEQIPFDPFVGVAPRRYMEFFDPPERKS